MKKRVLIFLLSSTITANLVNGGITYKAYANEIQTPNTNSNNTDTSLPPAQTLPSDQTQTVFPISIYNGETDIAFTAGHWGNITASISQEGVDSSNYIKYSNLENNPYSPGPEILFSNPKDISNMVDSDRLHLIMDIGIVPTSQPVRIIFNGNPSLNIVTPNLNKTSVFEELNLDISSIRAQLGGKITKISFEGAGPNGWQGVKNLYVKEISIIRTTDSIEVPTIAPVQPFKQVPSSLPISIYSNESNIYFNPAQWGNITGNVTNEGVGGTNCIKYSNLMNNVYAPSPEAVFPNPINISNTKDTDKLQLSISLGNASPAQAIRIIFNGNSFLNIVTPVLDTRLGFKTLTLDISKIKQQLGGQITQMSFESAGSNGWNNVNNLYLDEISIVSSNFNDPINVQPTPEPIYTVPKNLEPIWNSDKTYPTKTNESVDQGITNTNSKILKPTTTQSNPIVTFKSKGLELAIRAALRKPSGNLYKSDVEKITELKIQQKDIKDLSGIENLTNLKTLDLAKNVINDVSPLKNLTNLKNLNLQSNKINNINSLKGLKNLQSINLGYNKINDMSPLKGLTKLNTLDLRQNQISTANKTVLLKAFSKSKLLF